LVRRFANHLARINSGKFSRAFCQVKPGTRALIRKMVKARAAGFYHLHNLLRRVERVGG